MQRLRGKLARAMRAVTCTVAAATLLVTMLVAVAFARAEPPNDRVAESSFLLGKLDEDDDAFDKAVADYRAAVDAAPDSVWAARAVERIDWLQARSEGEFVPLARLEHVRRSPALSSSPEAIDRLAQQAETFPPGAVRVESRMLAAEAWLRRMNQPQRAIAELRAVTEDSSCDPVTARLAEQELVDALLAHATLDEAVAEARANAARLDARFLKGVLRLVVRHRVRRVAIAVLAIFAALAATAMLRAYLRGAFPKAVGAIRRLAPLATLFAAFLALAGGLLASKYESGNSAPFLLLGSAALPLVLLGRAWGAVGSPRTASRAARALLCAATMFAAAFLLLEGLDPQYLSGFGL
jgi:hypothetical protein